MLSISMHPTAVAQVLAVLTCANGAPVLAKKALGDHFAWPLDLGLELADGRRLFGLSKTFRGVLLAVGAGWASAPVFGLQANLGLQISVLAMAGDLLTSFLKRRLNRTPSSRALGLDQIPESFLPLLSCVGPLGLTLFDLTAGTLIFLIGELLVSRVLYRLHVRDQPY